MNACGCPEAQCKQDCDEHEYPTILYVNSTDSSNRDSVKVVEAVHVVFTARSDAREGKNCQGRPARKDLCENASSVRMLQTASEDLLKYSRSSIHSEGSKGKMREAHAYPSMQAHETVIWRGC